MHNSIAQFPLAGRWSKWAWIAAGLSLYMGSLPAYAGYFQQNLVSNIPGKAQFTDPKLINPWGISESSTSPFWISDAGAGVSTLYNTAGAPNPLVVNVPGGDPTGQVFNGGNNFQINDGASHQGPARFIFATEAGIISGWNPNVPPASTQAFAGVDNSSSAIYKGLAIDSPTAGTKLYAANFKGDGQIDVFDGTFTKVVTPLGAFTDPNLPAGYAPFNIQNIGGVLYVAYAFKSSPSDTDETPGAGLGIVDKYDLAGNLITQPGKSHFIEEGGALDAPWGFALAPSNFGEYSNDLLVGNFGDGTINAFDPLTGQFLGALKDAYGNSIEIDGLWGLTFGNGGNGGRRDTLYFAAGINDEADGLFGSISAPEPSTFWLMGLGLARLIGRRETRRRG